ncbi:MAG: hypothetical protein KF785_14385 [Gemmatimonadales bacterium]|nr:hypothetical protein [Gemmatimonadales bacterium]
MPTYLYAPADGTTDEVFELRQAISDPPYASHPETGQPIRRVITGGLGPLVGKRAAVPPPDTDPGGCNGPTCACR